MPILPDHDDEIGDEIGRVNEILGDAETYDHMLSPWELEFTESIRERVHTYGRHVKMSAKQWEALDRIEAKLTET